jgi:hypothetical protein
MKPLDYLDQLDSYLLYTPSLDEADVEKLIPMLGHHQPMIVARAGQCLMNSDAHLEVLLKELPTLPLVSQKIIALLVASSDKSPAFVTLLALLRDTKDRELTTLIIDSLCKTPYPIFPLLLESLYSATATFRDRLREVVSRMPSVNIFPFLAIFPVIPYEAFFREALGDETIEHIYQK